MIMSIDCAMSESRVLYKQAVRVATQYAPALDLLPRWRPSASRADKQTQRSRTLLQRIRSYADCCSRLTL